MTGPTPLTAPARLSFRYTVLGEPHVCRAYCQYLGGVDPDTTLLLARSGGSNPTLTDTVDAFFAVVAPFYNPSWATFDGFLLENRVDTEFVYQLGGSTTVAPTGAGTPTPATGWCVSGKSSDNRNMPAYLFEGNFRILGKVSGYSSLNTAEKAVNDYFFRIGGTPLDTDAYNWRKSRGEFYAVRWLASVWDSNQKLRRTRRIA